MPSLCIFYVHVGVNNIKVLNVAMKMQQLVPFALLSDYRILRTAINTKHNLGLHVKARYFCQSLTKSEVSQYIFVKHPVPNFTKMRLVED